MEGSALGRATAAGIRNSWSRMKAWSQGLSSRERVLVLILGLGALAFGAFSAADWAARARTELGEAQTALSAAEARQRRARPVADAVEASPRDQLAQLERWRFEGANVDIVAAEVEQRLLDAAEGAALPRARVRVEPAADAAETGMVWLTAQIEADLLWDPTFSFLELVSAWPEAHRVTALAIEVTPLRQGAQREAGRPIGTVRVELAFPARIIEAGS